MTRDPRPACLITSEVSHYRAEPFRRLALAEDVEVLAFAQPLERARSAVARPSTAGSPRFVRLGQAAAVRRVAEGRYRAVVAGLGGRIALPGAFAAARSRGVPFVLWASLWAHPRSFAHLLSYAPTRLLYRHADAVVTYGPHVSAYVAEARGSDEKLFVAPQAVDGGHFASASPEERDRWRAAIGAPPGAFVLLFVGRLVPEKGVEVLLEAFRRAALASEAVLVVAGEGPLAEPVKASGARWLGRVGQDELPALYAAADAVCLPSVGSATFREPWGLVVNEAMHAGKPVITTDAVGAAAGGLVRDGRNGRVVGAGDAGALAAVIRALAADRELGTRLGAAGREDVAAYSVDAWVEGMQHALQAVGAGRSRC